MPVGIGISPHETKKKCGLTSSGFFSRSFSLPCLGLLSWLATAESLSIAEMALGQFDVL